MKQGVVCQEVSGSLVQASTLTEICVLTCSLALNYCSDEVPPDSHIITFTKQWFLLYRDQDAQYLAGSSPLWCALWVFYYFYLVLSYSSTGTDSPVTWANLNLTRTILLLLF